MYKLTANIKACTHSQQSQIHVHTHSNTNTYTYSQQTKKHVHIHSKHMYTLTRLFLSVVLHNRFKQQIHVLSAKRQRSTIVVGTLGTQTRKPSCTTVEMTGVIGTCASEPTSIHGKHLQEAEKRSQVVQVMYWITKHNVNTHQ